MISAGLLIAAPLHKRPGSSGQTSFVASTSQSVRFARSLATRFQSGQHNLHTCVCPLKWVGGTRVHAGRWHAGRTLRRHTYIHTYIHTYLPTRILISWSRVLPEKLTGSKLVSKFPQFYGTRTFITAFTSARHLSLSWTSSIQSKPPHPTS